MENAPSRVKQGEAQGRDAARTTARDRLVAAAMTLFDQEGFHAVGIDRILRQAGVAKMTLYKHFPSKQALIVTVLERRLADYFGALDAATTKPDLTPRERLLTVFDVIAGVHSRPGYRGCLFLKAAGEFPDHDDPVHKVAIEHKRRSLQRLTELAEAAGAASPRLLAQRLLLLCEGATSLTQVVGGTVAIHQARDAAVLVLRQMLPQEAALQVETTA